MYVYTTIILLIALLYEINKCGKRKIAIAVLERNRMELSNKIAWLEAELDKSELERKSLLVKLANQSNTKSN